MLQLFRDFEGKYNQNPLWRQRREGEGKQWMKGLS